MFGVKTRNSLDASLTSMEEDPASEKFLLYPLSNRELLKVLSSGMTIFSERLTSRCVKNELGGREL